MTGPDPRLDEPPDPLEAALNRYARAFPKAGLPFLRGAGGPEAERVAVELLDRAVAKGRPWTLHTVASVKYRLGCLADLRRRAPVVHGPTTQQSVSDAESCG